MGEQRHGGQEDARAPGRAHGGVSALAEGGFLRAFDEHHPPDPDIIADCVHCGFCLPTCPTYLLWGEEMDSPRGRILLMKAASEGDIGLSPATTRHFDQCLGCMACVTACPSGVRYDRIIEATRAQVERRTTRTLGDQLFRSLLFTLFPYPRRLRSMVPLLWAYQRLGGSRVLRWHALGGGLRARWRAMESVLAPVSLRAARSQQVSYVPARAPRRRVGLLTGCVQRVFFDHVNAATVRVLTAEGCDVVMPADQGCCGALSLHVGREREGLNFARRLIDQFDAAEVETIVGNAGGCGSTFKEYGYLLRDDPMYAERARQFSARVRDVTELLAELEPQAPRHPLPLRVAYHDACHLRHAQGIRREPRAILAAIPGIELLEIAEADICCGSAGVYNMTDPEPAPELAAPKARTLAAPNPHLLAPANPRCLPQISAGLAQMGAALPPLHPVELVDASIRGELPPALRAAPGAGQALR